ncbi:hypothetical protein ACLOAV_000685 [Pseudogymnoascus australis]
MSLSRPERSRQERRFLRDCCPNYWGFAIYRTVYTPESDLLWEGTIAKLDEYVINSIWRSMEIMNLKVEEGEDQLDPEPTREVCARYRNIIMSDKEKYDGASIDEVADHFTDWADDPNNDQSGNVNMNQPIRILFTGGTLSITDPNSSACFLGPARRVKGEAETEILAFAENRGKIEVMVTRPGMVHAPGSVVGVLVAGFPAALKGVGVRELAAVSLDVVIKGWQGR